MPLRQKRDAKAQTSYWRGAYGKIRAALEARIKHNTLESAFVILKSRKQGRALLSATFRSFRSFRSVPGFTNTPRDPMNRDTRTQGPKDLRTRDPRTQSLFFSYNGFVIKDKDTCI